MYPSLRGGYNWQAVPMEENSFGQRKAVPSEWRGLKGSDLQKVTGVATATFCHPGGFIGGADELNDAIAMARLAIASN